MLMLSEEEDTTVGQYCGLKAWLQPRRFYVDFASFGPNRSRLFRQTETAGLVVGTDDILQRVE